MKRWAGLILLLAAGPAAAVGLGPLQRSGVTDGPGKAFYLMLHNPYRQAEEFQIDPLGADTGESAARVRVVPSRLQLAGGSARRILVIVKPLSPGETYIFRVCAQRVPTPEETIHARVCSKLSARRLPARA
jgi:hypothetical protein